MGNLFFLLNYLIPVVVGILTIFIAGYLSRILIFLFDTLYERFGGRRSIRQEMMTERNGLFVVRIAKGLAVGLLNWAVVYFFGLNRYILFLVFLAFLIRFSERFDAYAYYEICNSDEKRYKALLLRLKIFHLLGYIVAVLPSTLTG